jgi:4-hydroxy-tetrahydrodipicolinate synthase
MDAAALRLHVDWLISKGIDGLMPCGTTGEGPLLDASERKCVLETVVEIVNHRVPVIAHVGTATARETINLARHAREWGVDAVSVVTPYFFRLPEEALVAYYRRVADAVPDVPFFLYNIPQNTGNALSLSTVEAVYRHCPNVCGIKDSSGDLGVLTGFIALGNGGFRVVCGSDRLLLRALKAGACASISGNANVVPEVLVSLYRAFSDGDLERATEEQRHLDRVRELLLDGQSLGLFKHALSLRGLRGGDVRSPLLQPSVTIRDTVTEQWKALSFLAATQKTDEATQPSADH